MLKVHPRTLTRLIPAALKTFSLSSLRIQFLIVSYDAATAYWLGLPTDSHVCVRNLPSRGFSTASLPPGIGTAIGSIELNLDALAQDVSFLPCLSMRAL
jgi:hypothetical protein